MQQVSSVDKKNPPEAQQFPRVIACGYREIKSSKTSLTFPAWLVQFDDNQKNRSCWWRSKRDFLLLFRATKRFVSIPKASLQKLAAQSPWQVPTTNDGISFMEESDSSAELLSNNYNIKMVKSIRQCDDYLRKIASCCEDDEETLKAWQKFSESNDTSGLIEPDGTSTQNATSAVIVPKNATTPKQASQLGQYFCSPSTAEKIVDLTMEFCNKNRKDYFNNSDDSKKKKLIFLEPSCGHGDILWRLLQKLKTVEYYDDRDSYRVIACDIDKNAIQRCEDHVKQEEQWIVDKWLHGNFLTTKENDVAVTEHHHLVRDDDMIVVLGGPPYTSGAGSGTKMERNLPDLFFQHCVKEWNAAFVAFILPERYRDNPIQAAIGSWIVETHELESSSFFFQGNHKVVQPSIIQCYVKTK